MREGKGENLTPVEKLKTRILAFIRENSSGYPEILARVDILRKFIDDVPSILIESGLVDPNGTSCPHST